MSVMNETWFLNVTRAFITHYTVIKLRHCYHVIAGNNNQTVTAAADTSSEVNVHLSAGDSPPICVWVEPLKVSGNHGTFQVHLPQFTTEYQSPDQKSHGQISLLTRHTGPGKPRWDRKFGFFKVIWKKKTSVTGWHLLAFKNNLERWLSFSSFPDQVLISVHISVNIVT